MNGTSDDTPMLGDCLLHLTHHEMQPECWRTVIETYTAFVEQWPELTTDALRDAAREAYKAVYERALLNATRAEAAEPMPDLPAEARREGQLVAARSHTETIHASRLTHVPARPDLGLTPWWTLCASGGVVRGETDNPVTCKTCLRLLNHYEAKIGDVLDA